jgi:hypothetical protein
MAAAMATGWGPGAGVEGGGSEGRGWVGGSSDCCSGCFALLRCAATCLPHCMQLTRTSEPLILQSLPLNRIRLPLATRATTANG